MPSATRNTKRTAAATGRAREAEDEVEDEHADAERGEEAQDHRHDEQQRRDQRAQQDDQDEQDHEQRDRDDRAGVVGGRVAHVVLHGRRAADQHARAAGRVRGSADLRHERVGLRRVRVGRQDRAEQDAGVPAGARRARPRRRGPRRPRAAPRRPSRRRARRRRSAPLAPLGNDSASSFWPSTDSTEPRNELPCVRPVEKFRVPSDSTSSSSAGADPDTARATGDALADPPPDAVGRVDARRPRRAGTRGHIARRPQIVSSAGSSVSIDTIATRMPSAPIGPRPAVPLTSAIDSDSSAASRSCRRRRSPGPRCAARAPSPRACPRGGAAPRGSARRAAGRSRCPRRTRARRGSTPTGR